MFDHDMYGSCGLFLLQYDVLCCGMPYINYIVTCLICGRYVLCFCHVFVCIDCGVDLCAVYVLLCDYVVVCVVFVLVLFFWSCYRA